VLVSLATRVTPSLIDIPITSLAAIGHWRIELIEETPLNLHIREANPLPPPYEHPFVRTEQFVCPRGDSDRSANREPDREDYNWRRIYRKAAYR
jgi:hypothetical protein